MGDWLDLLAVCVNECMRRKWLENGLGYVVYVHYMSIKVLVSIIITVSYL